jgi:hypothetical protein
VRRECLDRILTDNRRHLLAVLGEFVAHDNEHRPHQGREHAHRPARRAHPWSTSTRGGCGGEKIRHGIINEYTQAA